MTCLGGQHGKAFTTQQLAQMGSIPAGYLSKVLQTLGKNGLVSSSRGLHGGFMLTREPTKITILDILNAVDPLKRIIACPVGNPQHKTKLCPLHQRLDDAIAMVENAFCNTTLAEVLTDPKGSTTLGLCTELKGKKSKNLKRKAL